jgi:hypothetical protein
VAGLASLASAINKSNQDPLKSAAYLIELSAEDVPTQSFSFQYFPESFTDSKTVSWQPKEIPGGSLPVYQWSSSGDRAVSFTAVFTADIDYGYGVFPRDRLLNAGQLDRNVDIRAAVYELRRMMLPSYTGGKTQPPPRLLLYLPRSGIGQAGGNSQLTATNRDAIVCVMTSCEITWEKFFSSGVPKIASVSLGFSQVPQYKGVVAFPSRGDSITNTLATTAAGTNVNSIRPYLLTRSLSPKKGEQSQAELAVGRF